MEKEKMLQELKRLSDLEKRLEKVETNLLFKPQGKIYDYIVANIKDPKEIEELIRVMPPGFYRMELRIYLKHLKEGTKFVD